ncbi:MAG: cytidylate kinase-like family protein [Bacteroidales bacterium]|jgi:cytidylate kinase|nr:cytidylate kinase-like family protein [Bacteroidales bacterium]
MKNFAINIGRSVGSGGHEIGKLLASKLKWNFYDNELIKMAAIKSGFSEELFEAYDEKRSIITSPLFDYFPGTSGSININSTPTVISEEYLFKIHSDVMKKLSEDSNAIFIGRCADYILRDTAECINIFCFAPKEFRIKNLSGKLNIEESKVEKLISKGDKSRSAYYAKFTDKKWGAAESYHLLIDTSLLGIQETAEYINDYIERRIR